MALEKSHEKIKQQSGHNSKARKEFIQEMAVEYAQCDKESLKLTNRRTEIREKMADMGFESKAWQDEINRAKQSLTKRDGYDESAKEIRNALGDMNMDDLFSHVLEAKREKEKEREAKEKERDAKAKAEADKKAEALRAKKNEKSVGEQQAAAITAAHTGKPN